jgi:hypothetical protein
MVECILKIKEVITEESSPCTESREQQDSDPVP